MSRLRFTLNKLNGRAILNEVQHAKCVRESFPNPDTLEFDSRLTKIVT